MKVLILLAVVIGYVAAESCRADGDCRHTQCDNNSQLHCVHGLCTCTEATDFSCTSLANCLDLTSWDCPRDRRHCIDGRCRCTRI
eukprot:XP_011430294.1 PREDICTED: serine protease inhibitor Cvsi-2-like [Crassostrea gigas]